MFFPYKMQYCGKCGEQEKESHYLCEDAIEKSVHRDHRLSSLGKPCNANL